MPLDIQTLYFLGAPVAIIAAAMVWLFGRWVPDARGTTTWALATLFWGITGILFAGRSSLPFFLTVVIANSLYVTSAALYHLAVCRIRKVSYPALFHIAIILLIALSFDFIFTDIKADYVARVLVVCPLLAIQYFLTARTLLGNRQAVSREEYLVLVFGAIPFILLGFAVTWRTVIHLPGVAVPSDGLLSNDANTLVTHIIILLAMVFFPYVFVQINNVISRQQVQRSESRLRNLVDTVVDWVWEVDNDLRLTFSSQEAVNFVGQQPPGLLGHKIASFYAPQSRDRLETALHECLAERKPLICLGVELEGSKNQTIFAEINCTPTYDVAGRPSGFIGVTRNITERTRAEEALAASRARFEAIFNSMDDAVIFVNRERRMALLNQAVEALFGYRPEELLGRTTEILYANPADYVKQGNLRYREDAPANQALSEIEYRRQDGTVFHAESVGLPVHDVHGHPLGFVGIHRDITERKRAEEALRESEARFRSLFESMTEGVALHQVLYDDQGRAVDYRIISTNPAFEKHTGLKPAEIQGQLASLAYGTGAAPYLEEYARVAQTGQAYSFETLFSQIQRHFRISVTSPKRGQFVTVFEDVTERKRAEETLRRLNEELEQRVKARTEELEETVAQLEEEVEERQQTEKQAATLGRLYRLLSRVYEVIVHAQTQEGLFRQACRVMMEEGDFLLCWIGRVDREAGLIRAAAQYDLIDDYPQNITVTMEDVPEGRGPTGIAVREGRLDVCLDIASDPRMAPWREQALARGFRSSAAFPLFVGGRVEGVLTLYSGQNGFFNTEEVSVLNSLAQDLSFAMESMEREARRRQAEEEIRRLNEELEQRVQARTAELEFANRELEAFSYSVSHDLKAPIRAIQGFSRMLLGEHAAQLDEEGLRLFNVIVTNTQTMANLINDLLALSRLGRQQVRKSRNDLFAMVGQVFKLLHDVEPEREVQLTVQPDLPPAWGDPSLLNQVMMNLLDNALKYTKAKKTAIIEVGGYLQGQETIYYVKDNGIGFDERYADKLFGVFQRLHGGPEYEGTGVGLAIVQRIIHRHGGRVWAEGKVEEGATFYLALPKKGE